jgi:hypothetical protein
MPEYNLDDLLQKEKADLEKLKLAIEINQAQDKHMFEKRKFKTENIRFFGIALFTSVLSLGTTYFIENFKQTKAQENEEADMIRDLEKSYSTELDKAKQEKIACTLADIKISEGNTFLLKSKADYNLICEANMGKETETKTILEIDTTNALIKNAKDSLKIYEQKIESLRGNLPQINPIQDSFGVPNTHNTQKQLINYTKKMETLIASIPEIKKAASSSINIEKDVKQIQTVNQNLIENKEIKGRGAFKRNIDWFKEGYFLQYDEYRILLLYVNKQEGAELQICKSQDSKKCTNPLIEKGWAKFGNPLQFSDNGKIYRINLEAVDHAGKNPFTLAAYVTFECLGDK